MTKNFKVIICLVLTGFALLAAFNVGCVVAKTEAPSVSLIPWPASLDISGSRLELTSAARIVYTDDALKPLAELLCQELYQITSIRFSVTDAMAKAGDIVLKIDPSLKDEAYSLEVGSQVVVTANNYKNTAMASVSLLQAVETTGPKAYIPKMSMKDTPHSWYRSLMIDVARQPHTIDTLKQCVVLCRI